MAQKTSKKLATDSLAFERFQQKETERKAKSEAQARRKSEEKARERKLFVDRQLISIAVFFFGGDIVDNKEFLKAFDNYVEKRLATCSCVVMYKPSKNFMAFMESFPDLPDIGRKEVIIYDPSMTHVRFFQDFRYPGRARGTRNMVSF